MYICMDIRVYAVQLYMCIVVCGIFVILYDGVLVAQELLLVCIYKEENYIFPHHTTPNTRVAHFQYKFSCRA